MVQSSDQLAENIQKGRRARGAYALQPRRAGAPGGCQGCTACSKHASPAWLQACSCPGVSAVQRLMQGSTFNNQLQSLKMSFPAQALHFALATTTAYKTPQQSRLQYLLKCSKLSVLSKS